MTSYSLFSELSKAKPVSHQLMTHCFHLVSLNRRNILFLSIKWLLIFAIHNTLNARAVNCINLGAVSM